MEELQDEDMGINPEMTDEEIVAEKTKYFASLKTWLYRSQMAQASAYLPYYFLASQMPLQFQPPMAGSFLNNNYQHQAQWPPYQPMNGRDPRNQSVNPPRNNLGPQNINPGARPQNNTDQTNRNQGVEYVIPPIWKRMIAEFLDFLFIFITKLVFTFIMIDYLDLIKLEKYSIWNSKTTTLHLIKQLTEDLDFMVEFSSEIIILEVINRLGACFFEAIFLSDMVGGIPLGATPGKLIMGIRVVYATNITAVENRPRETVMVYPATHLSFPVAFARSALKNALITIIFPICLFTVFFQFNRTTYDLICNVIVVEMNPTERRRL